MSTRTVLTSQHTDSRWTVDDVREKLGRELESDPGLAEFLAAAPNMARALKAVLNLDLGEMAERLVRAEISAILP
jgi:pantoate kinase